MDNTIRTNENCIVSDKKCGSVFASTRTCFIAYGFSTSRLEVKIVTDFLEKNQFNAADAGRSTNPGQFAFCRKICGPIISSQFCIVFWFIRILRTGMSCNEVDNQVFLI